MCCRKRERCVRDVWNKDLEVERVVNNMTFLFIFAPFDFVFFLGGGSEISFSGWLVGFKCCPVVFVPCPRCDVSWENSTFTPSQVLQTHKGPWRDVNHRRNTNQDSASCGGLFSISVHSFCFKYQNSMIIRKMNKEMEKKKLVLAFCSLKSEFSRVKKRPLIKQQHK